VPGPGLCQGAVAGAEQEAVGPSVRSARWHPVCERAVITPRGGMASKRKRGNVAAAEPTEPKAAVASEAPLDWDAVMDMMFGSGEDDLALDRRVWDATVAADVVRVPENTEPAVAQQVPAPAPVAAAAGGGPPRDHRGRFLRTRIRRGRR
jgi:hypothetical protein